MSHLRIFEKNISRKVIGHVQEKENGMCWTNKVNG